MSFQSNIYTIGTTALTASMSAVMSPLALLAPAGRNLIEQITPDMKSQIIANLKLISRASIALKQAAANLTILNMKTKGTDQIERARVQKLNQRQLALATVQAKLNEIAAAVSQKIGLEGADMGYAPIVIGGIGIGVTAFAVGSFILLNKYLNNHAVECETQKKETEIRLVLATELQKGNLTPAEYTSATTAAAGAAKQSVAAAQADPLAQIVRYLPWIVLLGVAGYAAKFIPALKT
jgi:hypothetical protein